MSVECIFNDQINKRVLYAQHFHLLMHALLFFILTHSWHYLLKLGHKTCKWACAHKHTQCTFKIIFIYFYFRLCWVFVAVHGAFSRCSEQGLLFTASMRISHCSGFSCCGAQALGAQASVVEACGLSSCVSWALEHAGCEAGISWTQFPLTALPRGGWQWRALPLFGASRLLLLYLPHSAGSWLRSSQKRFYRVVPVLSRRCLGALCKGRGDW